MARDTTLDAFANQQSTSRTGIRTTMAFLPDGATCANCGETVIRLWRTDDELVCSACKPWNSD